MDDGSIPMGGASGALRLADAMRERALAAVALESARLAFEAAKARYETANEDVSLLGADVTMEQLLELVSSLTARVAELEIAVAERSPAIRPAGAAALDGAGAPRADDGSSWGEVSATGGDDSERGAAPWPPATPAPSQPAGAAAPLVAPSDADDWSDGRRKPNRPLLFMEGYEKGFFEAENGEPDSMVTTRGWEVKGYRAGRADAMGGLEFSPLEAFFQEMRMFAPREPLTESQRQDAARIAAKVLLERNAKKGVAQRSAVAKGGDAAVAAAGGSERLDSSGVPDGAGSDVDLGDDDEVTIPGFLSRG